MAQLFDIKKVTVGPKNLEAVVELAPSAPLMTGDDPAGTQLVLGLMPELADHLCLGDASSRFGEVIADTELAHLLEHVTVELLARTDVAGDISSDGATGQVGHMVAELLGIPCAADARRIETEDGGLQVLRQWKDQKIRVRVKLPCMVTVGLGSNQVILPTLRSQMKANKREIPELTNAELGLDPESIGKRGAKSLVTDTYARGGSQHHAQMLTGSAGEIAAQIKALIEEASK